MRIFIFAIFLMFQASFVSAAGPRIALSIDSTQLFEFDETGWITLTNDQRQKVSSVAGFTPSRIRPVHDEPDGEVAELGYNMALRTSDNTVEVFREFLMTDEEVKTKIKSNQSMIGAMRRSAKEYPSFLIDSEGKYWKFISRADFIEEIKRSRKRIGMVYIQRARSAEDADTIAFRDGLRSMKAILKKFNLPSYGATE